MNKTILKLLVYCALISVTGWQGVKLYHAIQSKKLFGSIESVVVNVTGNVERPGHYRIPAGTSQFEILQVAGIRMTSDLTPFNLAEQVESEEELSVGTRENPVAVKANVRLEFYFGDVTILSSDGRERVQQEGMTIDEGDRILTEEKAQAELSLNTYSRIDMDNFAEITLDKIGGDEEGKTLLELFQKTGLCWYKIAYTDKNEQHKILTPLVDVTVGGKGADFTIDAKYSETVINVLDGLVLIERPDGSDAMNLITGQSVTIYRDNRPFGVTKLAPDENVTERFSQLTKTKADIVMRHMPFNVLFCSPPQIFMLISVQFEQNKMYVIQIPPQISVSLYVQGFTTLQEAFLYGGVVFTSTLVERILNTRVQKFAIFGKDDIVRTASTIGGLKVTLDDQASAMLGLGKGTQTLKGQRIIHFLSPALSGSKDSERRQTAAIKSIFDELVSKNIIITSLLAEQILANIETNISPTETMKQYTNFISRKNWSFISHSLPVRAVKQENQLIYEPIMEDCRKLLTGQ